MADYVVDKGILGKPREKYWITYIKKRIQENKNFLGFVSGATGSGKSYSSLRICEELDPEFSIKRCVFGGLELMNLINSGVLKKRSSIVFEEIGVELSNKNWASITNRMINYLLQTFRARNFVLIMNSPYMDFVDSSTRKLFHSEMRTVGIDFKNKEVRLKAQLLQYNSRLKKFYYKRLKVIKPEGKVPIDIWRVAKPTEPLRLAYEKKKREYSDRLNKKIYDELEAVEQKGKKNKTLTEIQQETLDLLKQGLNIKQIAVMRDRGLRSVQETVKWIKKKGYKLTPIFDKVETKKVKRYEIIEPNR